MMKKICTLLILCSTIIISGQNVTLLKNFNPKVKELKHDLNSTKDSLILRCENTIVKVEIFNEDYEKLIVVENHNTEIYLNDIPAGKFAVEVTLADKVVLMDIIKYEDYEDGFSTSTSDIAEGQGMMLDESLNIVKSSPNKSIEFILTGEKRQNTSIKKQKFYWVITKINTESGSSKTMKLADQKTVDRMILKNKVENSRSFAKFNELTVWEVYNTTKFMEQQVLNSNYVYSKKSSLFNTTPYYATQNTVSRTSEANESLK